MNRDLTLLLGCMIGFIWWPQETAIMKDDWTDWSWWGGRA